MNKRGGRRSKTADRRMMLYIAICVLTLLVIAAAIYLTALIINNRDTLFPGETTVTETQAAETTTSIDGNWEVPDYVSYEPLTPNEYSRPQTELSQVDCIVIHYVANPGTTAEQNRSYYEGLAQSHETYVSSHFIIGTDGSVIQCIPLNEESYASNSRNFDSISIECCHMDETGEFTDATYQSLIRLTADLCRYFGLNPQTQVIRHYDVTGKLCPLYYVNHEDAWLQLKNDVSDKLAQTETDN